MKRFFYISVLLIIGILVPTSICFSGTFTNQNLVIDQNYQLINKQRVSRTVYEYTYRANITNNGSKDVQNVTATVTSADPNTTVVDGDLNFGNVAAGATVTSTDTFSIRHDRRYPMDWSKLVWSIQSTNKSRVIEFIRANPDTIFVGEPATVTVTVQIGADPELIMNQIYLLRVESTGNVLENYGLMYDDGTHGDSLIGDGTFTTQIRLDESDEGQVLLMVEANYSAPPTTAYSDIVNIAVMPSPSPEVVDQVLLRNAQISEEFDNLAAQEGYDKAREDILSQLQNDPFIKEAYLSTDGSTIVITYTSGLSGGILTSPVGYKNTPENRVGTFASHPDFNNATIIASTLNNTCVDCNILSNAFTLNQVKNFDNKGVLYLDTHGSIYGQNNATSPIAILTGEAVFSISGISISHLKDWQRGRIVPLSAHGTNYWAFLPSFIQAYCHNFPDSLIVISACYSLKNRTMANAFLYAGAATYVGWSGTVSTSFSNESSGIDNIFFSRLANGDSVEEAFNKWTLPQRTDPSTEAIFEYVGDGSLTLPKELIENGNFETGDLSGWTTGFTVGGDFPEYSGPGGYWTVISERKYDGTYSARLGRFDQTYTQGLQGPPQPGDEPSGREWIYQDVKLPPNSHKILSFYYKIRTYDTAVWDWFDAFIIDPDTGARLATIVSKAGKPGTDYGEYWESDWQKVTYDLTPFAGKTIRIQFECREDGWGDQTAVYLDKISIPCD